MGETDNWGGLGRHGVQRGPACLLGLAGGLWTLTWRESGQSLPLARELGAGGGMQNGRLQPLVSWQTESPRKTAGLDLDRESNQ